MISGRNYICDIYIYIYIYAIYANIIQYKDIKIKATIPNKTCRKLEDREILIE